MIQVPPPRKLSHNKKAQSLVHGGSGNKAKLEKSLSVPDLQNKSKKRERLMA